LVKAGALLATFLLAAPPMLAGDRVHAPSQPAPQSQPVTVRATRVTSASVTIAVAVVDPTPAAPEAAYINLRGPDGQVRRFAVEGGREALASRVVVLRPGESVTIRLAASK
jgi:hypothetical protein